MASSDRSFAFTAASVPDNYSRHLAPAVFQPWAEILVKRTGVHRGDRVLDIASGSGVVARQAAGIAGSEGAVVATDVSEPMLAVASSAAEVPGAASIDYVPADVAALPFPDDAFDVVLCQQGFQFFTDRPAAARQVLRVLRPGGLAGIAVWAAGHHLEPFDDYIEKMVAAGVQPPFPGAFEPSSYKMDQDQVLALLIDAGFTSVDVSLVEHTVAWPDPGARIAGIMGTPFGPLVAALEPNDRAGLEAGLAVLAGSPENAPAHRLTVAVVARAVA